MTYRPTPILLVMLYLICFTYAGSPFAGTTSYVYDELNRLKEVHYDAVNWVEYTYDEIGNMTAKTPHGNVATITTTSSANGTVLPAGATTMFKGGDRTFAITPAVNCHIVDVLVDGVSKGVVSSYAFNNVTTNHTIQASFALNPVTITTSIGSPGTGGTISPASAVVAYGGSQTFTITPDAGFAITDVKVDGGSKGAIVSYPFVNVTADHTISASFARCLATAVKNSRTGTKYAKLQDAYNDAALLNGDTILVTANQFTENFTASGKDISITIDGGYKCDYSANPYTTIIKGAPSISSGTVQMKNISIIQ